MQVFMMSNQMDPLKSEKREHILIQQHRLAALGELVSNVGNQWTQPLNSLSLLIQDVREAYNFGEIDEQYIESFTRESMLQIKQMLQTIQDLRRFYRPNNEKQLFCISDAIEDALSIFSASLEIHHIQVDFEYRGQQRALGIANEFSQAVLHILANSRDAFVAKQIKVRKLLINIIETEDSLSTVITDNAGGIDPQLIESMFDPYFSTRPDGTGIGLFMTRSILENMDGRVEAVNTKDGVRFSLVIPKSSSDANQE
jgi:signal transduction histidine kinase